MRRVGLVVIGVGAAVVGLGTPAMAEPSPNPGATAAPGEAVCTVSDPKLIELSGIVATADGYVVENDSNDQASLMRVSFLDSSCKPIKSVSYPANNPARDPEDLALDSTGALWVADIGDNVTSAQRRDTIALWKVPSGNGAPVIHRMRYPDGAHDAEALLFGPGDVPVIVTKDAGGTARLYQPSRPLQANAKAGVALTQVGTFKPTRTGTSNLLGASGNIVVTGAATSPDRKKIVLRTYSDAYEWDVTGGDVVAAITKGVPRITPLPGEPLGEGITYSADGKSFLTCSDQAGPSKILRYRPAVSSAAVAGATTGTKPKNAADSKPWYKRLTLPQIINLVAALGVLGLVLVVVGVLGIQLSRRARRKEAVEGKPPADDDAGAAGVPVPVNSSAAPVVAENDRPTDVLSRIPDNGSRPPNVPQRPQGGSPPSVPQRSPGAPPPSVPQRPPTVPQRPQGGSPAGPPQAPPRQPQPPPARPQQVPPPPPARPQQPQQAPPPARPQQPPASPTPPGGGDHPYRRGGGGGGYTQPGYGGGVYGSGYSQPAGVPPDQQGRYSDR